MESRRAEHHIDRFVLELLSVGRMLSGLVSELADAMPPYAYPEEEPGAVLIEMLCGTIRTALESADPRDVRTATALIGQAGARTLEHLRLARELSQRIHHDGGGTGRRYG
jgi:hypothetical protein